MLGLLFLAYNLSTIDRNVINLFVEPIQADLGLNNTQMSLLQGLAFAIVYSLSAFPMGLLVDRMSRTGVIAGGLSGWSLMTSLCGVVVSFPLLFLARMGVGVGEAALSPAAYSLITDAFPARRRAFALGAYTVGGATGAGVGLIVGGALYAAFSAVGGIRVPGLGLLAPWQATFLALGAPGLVLALVFLVMREPARPGRVGARVRTDRGALWRFYRTNPVGLAALQVGAGACSMAIYALVSWTPAFFTRVHDWPISRIGVTLGLINIAASAVGLLGGGLLADRLLRGGAAGGLWLCIVVALSGGVAAVVFALGQAPIISLIALGVFMASSFLPFNVANALLQTVAPDPVRGAVSGVFLLVTGLLSSVGPLLTGVLMDTVFPNFDGVRASLAIAGGGAMAIAIAAFALTLLMGLAPRRVPDVAAAGAVIGG